MPSADIPHDPANALRLPSELIDVENLRIPDAAAWPLTLDDLLHRASTDALVVLHRGRIVIERYANGMALATPHILMSVSKSLVGLLVGVLIADGKINSDILVTSVLPELEDTAYVGAKIWHLLDMRTGVAFTED